MQTILKQDAISILQKNNRETLIYEVVLGAWLDWKNQKQLHNFRRKTTRASIVWERMIDRAIGAFDGATGIIVFSKNDTYYFVFDEKIVLKFKKGDENKFSRNYPTSLALAYYQHNDENQLIYNDFFGFNGLHRVEVIYVLNFLQTEIESVYLVARNDKHIIWDYRIEQSISNITPLPIEPQNKDKLVKKLVNLKSALAENKRKKRKDE